MAFDNSPQVIPIWPQSEVSASNPTSSEQEIVNVVHSTRRIIRNVTIPNLTVYLPAPAVANGTGVVICPGGGFKLLCIDHEGVDLARWFNERGVTAFVLKYRLEKTPILEKDFLEYDQANAGDENHGREILKKILPLAVADGRQALKVVREHSSEWGVQPDRIGIIGFSAGGSIVAEMLFSDDLTNQPDFAASIYGAPWESGQVLDKEIPLFIALASDDPLGEPIIDSCFKLYSEWNKAGYAVELHAYAEGGHGFGMIKQGLPCDSWVDRYGDWLRQRGLIFV